MSEYSQITNAQIGAALLSIRRAKRKTQMEVAEAMGVSQSFISSVERGEKAARTDLIVNLVKYYGVSYESVFGDISPKKQERDETADLLELLKDGISEEVSVDFDLLKYVFIRRIYSLNPHNSEKVFTIPIDKAIDLAVERIVTDPGKLARHLRRNKGECRKIEFPVEYNGEFLEFVTRCESVLRGERDL